MAGNPNETVEDPAGVRDDLLLNQVSIFPVPPLDYFSKYFSDEVLSLNYNISEGIRSREPTPGAEETERPKRFPSPPPVPEDDCCVAFGIPLTPTDHLLRDLDVQGIVSLGTESVSRKVLLKRLLWSAISKFLEIVDYLIKNPGNEKRSVIIEELQTIFINFHHVVNQYRLPQARESVVELIKIQKISRVGQTQALLDSIADTMNILRNLQSSSFMDGENSTHQMDIHDDHDDPMTGQTNGLSEQSTVTNDLSVKSKINRKEY